MARRRNPQLEVEGPGLNPQLEVDPQPLVEARRRGEARARDARRIGIREVSDQLDRLERDPRPSDEPAMVAHRYALERLQAAEVEDP